MWYYLIGRADQRIHGGVAMTAGVDRRAEELAAGAAGELRRSGMHYKRVDDKAYELTTRRVGATPEAQLRWVVKFAERDLGELRPGELVSLGDDLRGLSSLGWQGLRKAGPMPEPELRRLHDEIAAGVRAYLSTPAGWVLPLPRAVRLERTHSGHGQRVWEGDEYRTIINAVADLLTKAGDRLRSCLECGKPFFAVKGQRYCSARCSQKFRDRSRPGKVPTVGQRRKVR
jgi:hypothetical protein